MLADMVGAQVAALRKRAGMTREDLSRATIDMGWPLTVDMLINIETRRLRKGQVRAREITVDELVTLARILNVPPILLLFPVGTTAEVEVGNGETAPVWHGVRWFVGEARLDGAPIDHDPGAAPLVLYRRHADAIRDYDAGQDAITALFAENPIGGGRPATDDEHAAIQRRERALLALHDVRAEMRRAQMALPDLPQYLMDRLADVESGRYVRSADELRARLGLGGSDG